MAGGRRLSRGGSAGALVGKQSTESDDESDFDDLMDDEDDEDDAVVPSGSGRSSKGGGSTQGGGRRRSSFGGARFANAEEQERVVSMYSNVIKLSSENKINDKNSWNLDLIDNMGKLIKNDSREQRGVNFQKASCTLDASVKIYSHRVDDTYSTSHRVLESFSRNQLTEEEEVEEENDDMDEDGVPKAKKASRVGSRKRSGAATTIEKNVDNINAKEIENEAKIDPIFQTMSKLFDKGGVHGMLMYNLRCVPNMPGMALCTEGLPDPFTGVVADAETQQAAAGMSAGAGEASVAEIKAHIVSGSGVAVAAADADAAAADAAAHPVGTATAAAAVDSEANENGLALSEATPAVAAAVLPDKLADLLDITAWVTEIGLSADDLSNLDICPQFDAWRGTSGMSNSQAGMVDPVDFVCEHQAPAAAADGADADADAMDTEEEGDKGEKEEEKESSTVAAARSKSALKAGFYDVSCLPFQSWAAEARDLARMKRKTALLSATSSSSSSSMRNVLPDGTITQQQQMTDASPEEGVLGFAPQTQECHYNDGDNHDNDDENEVATFDMAGDYDGSGGGGGDDDGMEAYMEQEGDDCDEDGNYIASERRKSMAPPAMMGAEGSGGNRQSSLMAMNGGRMSLLPGPLASSDGGINRASMSPKPQGKIQWGAINGDTQVTTDDLVDNLAADEQEAEAMIDGLAAVAGMISAGGAAASEYAFFDVETVSMNNNWAGAKHWKWGSSKAKKAAADAAAASTSDRALRQRNSGGDEDGEHSDDDAAMAANDDEQAAGAAKAKPKKKASKKATGTTLDFATCLDKKAWAAESAFSPPKGRTDTTCMTAAAIEKATNEADDGELFLPKDEKVEAKDLCRLFSVKEMVVPPVLLRDLVMPSSMQQGGRNAGARFARSKAAESGDLVWKCASPSDNTTTAAANGDGDGELGEEPLGDDVGDYGEGGGDDGYDDVDYDDDRFYVSGDGAAPAPAPASSDAIAEGADSSAATTTDGVPTVSGSGSMPVKGGSVFDIDQSKLIKLDRKVEKINIGYSVIPKKVNVKQLKIDIWDQVATLAGVEREGAFSTNSPDDEEDENEAPPPQDFHATQSSTVVKKTTDTTMSFQSLVNTVAGSQKQKEVTLSFYFICLLHLANEKTLKITDDKDTLDELVISSDSVGR
jgi:hypothetical protein